MKNNDGFTPLHYASMDCRTEVVNLLIEKGADIQLKDNYGNAPLGGDIDDRHDDDIDR